MQPEIRSFVLVLRSPVSPFDRSKTKNANCFELEECNVFLATQSVNSAPFKRGVRGANFWQGEVQISSPILRCIFLARKRAKLIANSALL